MDFGGSWEKYLPLVEFDYNNSYHSTIGMAPYEALYGRKCRSPSCWMKVGDRELEGPELIRETSEKITIIQERMRTAFSRCFVFISMPNSIPKHRNHSCPPL